LRERLLDLMWEDVGIIRDEPGLNRALDALAQLEDELLATGVADSNRAFNLTWSDWLNLRSQIDISKVFAHAALKRENSRGAHFRSDFPDPGDLATSRFTIVRQRDRRLEVSDAPVEFTIVKPGQTLLKGQEAAE
jgi:fumarate reductase flavoprotein subunit